MLKFLLFSNIFECFWFLLYFVNQSRLDFTMKNIIRFFIFIISFIFINKSVVAQKVYPKKIDNHYIFINKKGKKAFKTKFEKADSFREGLAAVRNDGKWGFIDERGKTVVPLIFDAVDPFRGQRAIVKKEQDFFLIDRLGEKVTNIYDSIYYQVDFYVVLSDSLYGYVDSLGAEIISPAYEDVGFYYDGIFTIKKGNRWGNLVDGKENFNNPKLFFVAPEVRPNFSKKCENLVDRVERKKCSDQALLSTLYRNIKYPKNARNNGFEGTAVIQFVIDTAGIAVNHRIMRKVGGGIEEESLRVSETFLTNWYKPGTQNGLPINTVFHLPVKFRLE